MVKVNRKGGRQLETEWHTERKKLDLLVTNVLSTHIIAAGAN